MLAEIHNVLLLPHQLAISKAGVVKKPESSNLINYYTCISGVLKNQIILIQSYSIHEYQEAKALVLVQSVNLASDVILTKPSMIFASNTLESLWEEIAEFNEFKYILKYNTQIIIIT